MKNRITQIVAVLILIAAIVIIGIQLKSSKTSNSVSTENDDSVETATQDQLDGSDTPANASTTSLDDIEVELNNLNNSALDIDSGLEDTPIDIN